MSTISPAGLAEVSAPLPKPREYTLLDAAQVDTPGSDRWLGGAWIEGYPSGQASTHDPCSAGTYRQKNDAGVIARPMAGAFTVYLPAQCDSRSIGPTPDRFTERLRLVFESVEPAAVERVLVDGDGHTTLGSYLGDTNMEVLGTGVTPVEGLALLERELATIGSMGMIHVPPATATYWASLALIESRGGVMRTKLGTLVAVGAGYQGARPDGEAAAGADEEWVFASGMIQITRSESFVMPADYAQALDRSNNDVLFLAERHYLLAWVGRIDSSDDDHVQAGVLVDRSA